MNIPLLTANDIECRVQSVSMARNGSVGAILLLYKDARVDMRILDQVFGINGWQRTHEVINGNLFCNIDIWDNEKKCWVRKQDVGVESNTEKEKGEASDSFKRAGTNVGIGRELYTAPLIYVALNESEYYEAGKDGKGKTIYRCYSHVKFAVQNIGYNDRKEINKLIIADRTGNVRFSFNGGKEFDTSLLQSNTSNTQPQPPQPQQRPQVNPQAPNTSDKLVCMKCAASITQAEANYSEKNFGLKLCRKCQEQAR